MATNPYQNKQNHSKLAYFILVKNKSAVTSGPSFGSSEHNRRRKAVNVIFFPRVCMTHIKHSFK